MMLDQDITPEALPEQTQSSAAPAHISGPWTFMLPEGLCRAPGLSANDRVNHFMRNRATQAVRDAVTYQLRSLINRRRMPARLEKVRVDITWYVRDRRRRDPNNLHPLAKAVCDAIGSDRGTGVRLVPDDDPEHMEQPTPRIVNHSGDAPGFIVTITNLGGLP
jgi:hypothetical protein